MSTNTTTQCLSVLQRPSSASDTASLRVQKSRKPFFIVGEKKPQNIYFLLCVNTSSRFRGFVLKVMRIPVPRLTTVPRPSPLLMTMVARILRPRRLCWMRVVKALKRW